MKKTFRILLCALAAAAMLTACGKSGDGEVTAEGPSASEVTQTTEAAKTGVSVVSGGATEYKIVRPDETTAEITAAAMKLHQSINAAYGIEMGLASDFEKRDFDVSKRHPYEIVVGATNRDESASAKSQLKYNDAIIAVMGTRVDRKSVV